MSKSHNWWWHYDICRTYKHNYYKEIYQIKKGKAAFKRFLESKYISSKNINLALQEFNENEDFVYNYATNFVKNKVGSKASVTQKLYASLINSMIAMVHGLFFDYRKHGSWSLYEAKTRKIIVDIISEK